MGKQKGNPMSSNSTMPTRTSGRTLVTKSICKKNPNVASSRAKSTTGSKSSQRKVPSSILTKTSTRKSNTVVAQQTVSASNGAGAKIKATSTPRKLQKRSTAANGLTRVSNSKIKADSQNGEKIGLEAEGKKRKASIEVEKSPKKANKPETADVFRPFVTEYVTDPTFHQALPIPFISTTFQSKLLIRAVLLNDLKLLQKLTQDEKLITSFCVPRCLQIPRDAFSYAIETENVPAMSILMPKILPEGLAPTTRWLIKGKSTGKGSYMVFGRGLRNVPIGRGGKEGNAALLKDTNVHNCEPAYNSMNGFHIIEALRRGISLTTLQKMKEIRKDEEDWFISQLLSNIFYAIRHGHNVLAAQLIEMAVTKGGFEFGTLHAEALIKNEQSPLSSFDSQSVRKKTSGNGRITPLHCAAVNPDPYCLSTLLSTSPSPLYTITDGNNWTLVHYAAACTGPGPLEYLISQGVPTNQINSDGDTPAHIAALNGRAKNIDLIIKAESKNIFSAEESSNAKKLPDTFSFTRPNKKGLTPLNIACAGGHLDVVKYLVASSLVDKNKSTPAPIDKLTPLMIAAGNGHLSVVKHLISAGSMLHFADRRGNTALTHAVINGHAHIVSYLLRLGDNHLVKDSSGNTLIHYACAYGWYFPLTLLLEAGCCPNEANQWKLTPLAIAFMKGHMGIVEVLLKQPGVNVNAAIDAKGLTLLLQTCSYEPSPEVISRLKYLIVEQKADCTSTDYEKNTAVHYLVEGEGRVLKKIRQQKNRGWGDVEERKTNYTLEALKILAKHGANLEAKNSSQETPISKAVNRGCFQLVQELVQFGAALSPEPNSSGDTLLHLLIPHLTEADSILGEFCKDCTKDGKSLAAMKCIARTYNNRGMTPLLQTLNHYPSIESPEKAKQVIEFILFLVIKLDSDVNATATKESENSILHFAAGVNYSEDVLNILLAKKPNIDPINAESRTPLTVAILKRNKIATKILLENGANVNYISTKDGEKSLILLEASQAPNTFDIIPLFVAQGSIVKDVVDSTTGNSVLHLVSKNPSASSVVEAIKSIIKAGVDVNSKNKYFRTSLHLAVNSRGGETDVSYDVEDALIEAGANLGEPDVNGRIPLHFAFLKIGKGKINGYSTTNSFMDPIELVTLLTSAMKESKCRMKIDAADEFGQTPLHLAAVRGATISASHLLAESLRPKEMLNLPDKNGNTPLGLAVLNDHEGCALMLLQAGADFVTNLTKEIPELLENEVEGSWIWKPVRLEAERQDRENENQGKYSILQEIVAKDWQGLLYLMLEKLKAAGSGVIPAIEAAMKTKRLKLASKLIDRVKKIDQLITKKRSLLHTLAQYSSSGNDTDDTALQTRILHVLVQKKADVNSVDSHQSTPLIYASIKGNAHLCSEFTQLMNIRQIPNLKADSHGRTPFSALFWDPSLPDSGFPPALKSWAESVIYGGGEGNVLCQYPIKTSPYPGVRYIYYGSNDPNYYMSSFTTKYSPLIIAVVSGKKKIVKWLLSLGKININFPDSNGMTALMHAARLNDIQMMKLLLNPSFDFEKDRMPWNPVEVGGARKPKTGEIRSALDLNAVDNNGWSTIHHVVAPLNSSLSLVYARAEILLNILASNGAQMDIRDRTLLQETPFDLALRLQKFSLARCIAEIMKSSVATKAVEKKIREVGEFEVFPSIKDSIPTIPLKVAHKDSKVMLDRLKSQLIDDPGSLNLVEPDSLTDLTVENSEVMIDEARQIPFDCLLTQVDLNYGVFGLYNFYKMQLIKQTKGPELILLFTRWGRMGDTGQYQKTPFSTEEDAMSEFKEIFKAKTGNDWDELSTNEFINQPKKCKLVSLDRGKFHKLHPKFDEIVKINFVALEQAAKSIRSQIPEDVSILIQKLCEEHKSKWLNSFDNSMLPFGQIQYETLKKAERMLDEIDKLLREEKKTNDKGPLGESILKLSEEYFTLIPVHGYAFEKIRPFAQYGDLRKQQQLVRNFLHKEFAFQLLLAAQLNQGIRNPFEYIYACLGTKLEILDESSEETQLILGCIYNTSTDRNRPIVEKIYRVEIPGKATQMDQLGIGNRHLLWHGTSTANLLSVLHHGLQIEHLGYTYNGSMFGKGIYFADMFGKSQKYCDSFEPRKSKFILLCEVALGGLQDVQCGYWLAQDQHILKPGNSSLKTTNSRWMPDPSAETLWKGRKVHMGQKCETVFPDDDTDRFGLDYNDYIIFKPEQANIKYLVQFQGSIPEMRFRTAYLDAKNQLNNQDTVGGNPEFVPLVKKPPKADFMDGRPALTKSAKTQKN